MTIMGDKRNEILSLFDQIINKAQSTFIFSNKCKKFIPIFHQMKIIFNQSKQKLSSEEILKKYLINFSKTLNDLNNTEWCINFLKSNEKIDQYFGKINKIIQRIYNCMNSRYLTQFNFPTEDKSEDIKQIKKILSKSKYQVKEFQKRREEIEEYYRKDRKYFTDIMNKYDRKYKLKQEDYIKKEPLFKSELFEYYKGEKTKTKEKIIIAVLKDREKFQTLLQIYTSIDHPNIEKFVGVSLTDSSIEFVTYLRGEPLTKIMQERKVSLTIIVFKIAEAMSYLHSKMIVFGDLNLSNIFIENFEDEDPTKVTPIITNFSNSIILKPNSFLETPNIIKTSPFCAPELISNYRCDEKVDVFDFGRLLYEFLTKSSPFEGQSIDHIKQFLIDGKRPEFTEDDLTKNNYLVSLINRCWIQKSIERYSFDQIINEMVNYSIIFPSDENIFDKIEQFYKTKTIKCKSVIKCLNLFDMIISNISGVYQFKLEFHRSLPFLANYKYLLHNSKYASNKNENKKIEDLQNELDSLFSIVVLARNQDTSSWFLDKEIDYVPKTLTNSMQNIHQIMTDLGFKVAEYQEDENDLIMDYNELECYYKYKEYNKEQAEQIANFLKEKNISNILPTKSLYLEIKNFLSPFNSYIIDRGDFYYKKKQIDDGASSHVYEGYCISSKEKVAIKIINDDYLNEIKNLINIRREINFLVKLNHKFLIKFVGFSISESKNHIWIVSKFINNNLYDIKNKLNAFQKTKIAFEIAEGMEYLHKHRIIHRDLKPLNILITKNLSPKIIDYGFCVTDLYSFTKTDRIGTSNYMAPEVIESKPYDRSVDVFSFGLSLWELYSGNLPYKDISNYSVVSLIVEKKRPEFYDDCPESLKKLIEDCWNDDPKSRPSFSQIIDRMINEKISFPENDDAIGFYDNDNNNDDDDDECEFNRIDDEDLPSNEKINLFYEKKHEIRSMNAKIQGDLD